MAKLTESDIEALAIERLPALGYDYVCGPDLAPDGDAPERKDYGEVLLAGLLEQAVRRINPQLPPDLLGAALKEVQRVHSPELLANNEAFHRLLTEGVPVSMHKNGEERGERVWLFEQH